MKAYVLHSGGMDSTLCLFMATTKYEPKDIMAVSMNYGQRHVKEIECAKEICKHIGCNHIVVDLPGIPRSLLTNPEQKMPNMSYAEISGVSPTYVPFRNGQLLSKIAAIASADSEGEVIYFGAHTEDAQDWAYPDCTPEFIGAMAQAIYIGTYHKVRLISPLQWLTKTQIALESMKYGVPHQMTWSCYAGGAKHCGVCPTCRSRQDAFKNAGMVDPTLYEEKSGESNV